MASCGVGGDRLFTVWGPLNDPEDPTNLIYSWGGSFEVTGLAHQVRVDDGITPARDFLEVVLVGGDASVSCSVYTDYLSEIQEIQGYIDLVRGNEGNPGVPSTAEWREYVCQQLNGAALRAFGGDGAYRAVHALMMLDMSAAESSPNTGLFVPRETISSVLENGNERFFGADAFDPLPGDDRQQPAWTYVSRTYERSRHGDGILPPAGDEGWVDSDPDPATWCLGLLDTFETELSEPVNQYPDTAAMALQAATNRYYHKYTTQANMALGSNGEAVAHGLVLPRWSDAAVSGDDLGVTLVGQATRTPATMPYERLVITSQSERVTLTPCSSLSPYLPVVWPELYPPG
jgi:hypothetical protein